METNRTCPQCQQPLSADAPDGLCPQCLMAAASGPPPSAAGDGLPGDIIDIGDPAEVAKKLPQFEILELLGRGGMGVVYKARQLQLDRLVALKILPPVDALSADFVARFTREARALAKLNHPNIVHVHDFGETGGLYYIIMEYVDGANLRQLLQTRKLAPAEALAIVPKICDALEYAHEEGLVHRDIKPENLLIDKKGRVKIGDFGLAKLLRREPLDMTLTLTGTALGTLRYMAPEQMDKPETVDHRADIYSLGVVIYEMLTGDVPMGHFAPPSQTAGVDVRLDKIVLHALEREPERRYQHASEVKTDVEHVTTSAAPVPSQEPIGNSGGAMVIPAPPAVSARLSRTALLGAIWAMIGLPAGLLVFAAFSFTWKVQIVSGAIPQAERTPLWVVLVTIPLALIAATAPFGTTILGAVGIGQIKRSCGRLYGLRLAAADALFFPLLMLGAAAFGFTHLVQIAVWTKLNTGYEYRAGELTNIIVPPPDGYPGMTFLILDSLVALGVCLVVAFFAWRKVTRTPDAPAKEAKLAAESGEPRLSRCALFGAIWAGLGFLAATFAGVPLFMLQRHQAVPQSVGAGEAIPVPALGVGVAEVLFILVPVGLIAASAPFGTTILGAIGIGHIKRSGGKLYGLRLSAVDALFFPLLVLGLAVFSVLFFAYRAVTIDWIWIPGTSEHPPASAFACFWNMFILLDVLVSLTVCFFAGRAAWRSIAGVKKEAGPKEEGAPPAGTKPSRRHLLTAFLTLLSLSAFFFGANFSAKSEMTPAGRTSITTVGSFDPLFVQEGRPSGFHQYVEFFSWSFFAIIVSGVSFAALWRVCREDEGKVARDPAWWRDWWKQVGIWCGLLFLACAIRTGMNARPVLKPVGTKPAPVEIEASR